MTRSDNGSGIRGSRPGHKSRPQPEDTFATAAGGPLRLISISGVMDDHLSDPALAEQFMGRIAVDLSGVTSITQDGVRIWLELAGKIDIDRIYLTNCSDVVVNQILETPAFLGDCRVVSIAAPYLCVVCNASFDNLIDCEKLPRTSEGPNPPEASCSECGNRAVFDRDPKSHFSFLPIYSEPVPKDVQELMEASRREWMSHVDDAVEKSIEGDATVFRINRNIDEKIRWSRVLAGVEGTVHLDFANSKGATQNGAQRLVAALRQATNADAILLEQVPLMVIEQLVAGAQMPNLWFRTISVPARCANCGVSRQATIDSAGINEARVKGLQPESECRRCSASIPILLPDEVIRFFDPEGAALPPPAAVAPAPLPSPYLIAAIAVLTISIVVALVVKLS